MTGRWRAKSVAAASRYGGRRLFGAVRGVSGHGRAFTPSAWLVSLRAYRAIQRISTFSSSAAAARSAWRLRSSLAYGATTRRPNGETRDRDRFPDGRAEPGRHAGRGPLCPVTVTFRIGLISLRDRPPLAENGPRPVRLPRCILAAARRSERLCVSGTAKTCSDSAAALRSERGAW